MKTYWDLTEKQRAALSRDEVTAFEALELMGAGVLPLAPLVLDVEPVCDDPPTKTVYRVRSNGHSFDCAFATMEDAQAFLALNPVKCEHSYLASCYTQAVDYTVPLGKTEIVAVDLTTEALFTMQRADMEKRAAVKKENTKREREHKDSAEKRSKALEGMWDDYYRCQGLGRNHDRVVETFHEYTRLTGGDSALAGKFLLKVFGRTEILAADEWTGVKIDLPSEDPEPMRPQAEPANAEAIAF